MTDMHFEGFRRECAQQAGESAPLCRRIGAPSRRQHSSGESAVCSQSIISAAPKTNSRLGHPSDCVLLRALNRHSAACVCSLITDSSRLIHSNCPKLCVLRQASHMFAPVARATASSWCEFSTAPRRIGGLQPPVKRCWAIAGAGDCTRRRLRQCQHPVVSWQFPAMRACRFPVRTDCVALARRRIVKTRMWHTKACALVRAARLKLRCVGHSRPAVTPAWRLGRKRQEWAGPWARSFACPLAGHANAFVFAACHVDIICILLWIVVSRICFIARLLSCLLGLPRRP